MLMFTYGTLIDDNNRLSILGHNTNSFPAKLFNYELINCSNSIYLTIKHKFGSITSGILFNVNEYDLIKLDRYENNLYDRINVMVNNTQCIAYIEKPQITMTKRGQLIHDHLNDMNNLFDFMPDEDELGV